MTLTEANMAAFLILLVTALAFIPLSILSFPYLLQGIGSIVGNWLRRKTAQRRAALKSKSDAERAEAEEQRKSQSSEEEDWEKVGPSRSGSDAETKDEIKVDKDWDGVIGFLHPFWYA